MIDSEANLDGESTWTCAMECFDMRPNTESRLPAETPSFLLRLVGQGTFEFDIVAESHYQDSLKELYGGGTHDGHTKKVEALLIYDYAKPV